MRGQQRKGQRRQQNFGQGFGPQGQSHQYGQHGGQYGGQQSGGWQGGTQGWQSGQGGLDRGRQGQYGQQTSHQYPGAQRSGSQLDDQRSGSYGGRGEDVWDRNTGGYPDSGSHLGNEGGARGSRGSDQYDVGADFDQGESTRNDQFEGAWYGQGSSGGSNQGWDDRRGAAGQGSRGEQGWQGGRAGQESWSGGSGSYGDQGGGRPQGSRSWDGGGPSRSRGVAPKGYKKSDQRLTEDLGEALMDEGIDCGNVEVQVKDGVVTITGEITDRADKYRIEHVAAGMMGVQDVDNQLRVAKAQGESKSGRSGESATAGQNQGGSSKNAGDKGRTH